jgi:uncharacterized protein YcgI (DUF1989 family)
MKIETRLTIKPQTGIGFTLDIGKSIRVIDGEVPLSKPGNFIELRAEIDLIVAVSACSVEQSKCNGYRCTSTEIQFIL